MLQLSDIQVDVGTENHPNFLLQHVNLQFHPGQFCAIVGPSGCGKSTLLKLIPGLIEETGGNIYWQGRDLSKEQDLEPGEVGYVPQFSIAHENLTVLDNLNYAAKLRLGGLSRSQCKERIHSVLQKTGLEELSDRTVSVLSGGQRRRLALSLELLSNPSILLCDEVTSGLDPKSEDEVVQLLRKIATEENKLVLSVTHSLRHLTLYDTITTLMQGRVIFHASSDHLLHYFQISHADDLFPQLSTSSSEEWIQNWENSAANLTHTPPENTATDESHPPIVSGAFRQAFAVALRRWHLFFRDPSQMALQATLILIFPGVVVLFAWNGLPEIKNLQMELNVDLLEQMKEAMEFTVQTSRVGSLVSGLVMFQVILLCLMGSNNAAREVVSERALLEKEKLAGLSPFAYLIGKCLFLAPLVLIQSSWMTLFVKYGCNLPGDFWFQFLILNLVTGAITATCFAISSWSKTTEQSSLISIYLVGFQLPLSGAVLALPEWVGAVTRPWIAAYWSWSGYLQTMKETRFYDLAVAITDTPLSGIPSALWMLSFYIFIFLIIAYLGIKRGNWRD